jgi:tetratricopeptide (TPR) repeat protein
MHRLLGLTLLWISLGLAWLPMVGQNSGGRDSELSAPLAIQPVKPDASNACLALHNRLSQLNAQKNYAAVVDAIKKSPTACPNRIETLLVLAKAQMLSTRLNASLDTLHQLLSENPDNIDALVTQGDVFYLQGNPSSAIESLKRAIQIAPDSIEAHYVLGRLYYAESNVDEATGQFLEVVKLDPANYKAYDGLGLCYENSDRIALAADSYIKGIALVYRDHPHYDVIYADFAELMLRYGENRKAFNLAVEAATRNPEESRDAYLAGKALYKDGHFAESIKWLERAIALDPHYAQPHYILARVYGKLGKMNEARQEGAIFANLQAKAGSASDAK